jgi:hypothetical protein
MNNITRFIGDNLCGRPVTWNTSLLSCRTEVNFLRILIQVVFVIARPPPDQLLDLRYRIVHEDFHSWEGRDVFQMLCYKLGLGKSLTGLGLKKFKKPWAWAYIIFY